MVGSKISPMIYDNNSRLTPPNPSIQYHRDIHSSLKNEASIHNSQLHSHQFTKHEYSDRSTQKQNQYRMIGPYIVEKTLGKGTFGKVYLCRDPTNTIRQLAVKVIEKANVKTSRERKNVHRELRLMKILYHPNIIQVHNIHEERDMTLIVMEHANGGELHDYITSKKKLDDTESRRLFRQLVSAVDYCHESSLIHRDLKPENLLLDNDKNIKLIDFGFGNTYSTTSLLNTFCGSPFYAAPEMTQGVEYVGPEVDIWSMGVILYMMLTGELPFMGSNIGELYDAIAKGQYKIPNGMDEFAVDLLSRMLCVNPKHRICMDAIKEHPWVKIGYKYQIRNFVPERPSLLSILDDQVMIELNPLGYSRNDYIIAFRQSGKSPVKSLYHLHNEWIQRKKCQLMNSIDRESLIDKPSLSKEYPPPSPPSLSMTNTVMIDTNSIHGNNGGGLVRPGSNSLNASPIAMDHPQPLSRSINQDALNSDKAYKSAYSPVSIKNSFFGRTRNAFIKDVSLDVSIKGIYHALSSITRHQAYIVFSSVSLQLSGSLTNCTLVQQFDQGSFSCSKCRITCKHHSTVIQAICFPEEKQEYCESGINDCSLASPGGLMEYSIDLCLDEKKGGILIQSKKLSGSNTDHKVMFQMLMNDLSTFLNRKEIANPSL